MTRYEIGEVRGASTVVAVSEAGHLDYDTSVECLPYYCPCAQR
jgi:hypothetical protein